MTSIAFLGWAIWHADGGQPRQRRLHRPRFRPGAGRATGRRRRGVDRSPTPGPRRSYADVVITMLPNGTLVRSCYDEVMPAAARVALFVDLHHLRR